MGWNPKKKQYFVIEFNNLTKTKILKALKIKYNITMHITHIQREELERYIIYL